MQTEHASVLNVCVSQIFATLTLCVSPPLCTQLDWSSIQLFRFSDVCSMLVLEQHPWNNFVVCPMMYCVTNWWNWRVLVEWGWNIRAKVLSHLVGVSGKCSDSCVGRHFGSRSSERTFRVCFALYLSCLTHGQHLGTNLGGELVYAHRASDDLVRFEKLGATLKTPYEVLEHRILEIPAGYERMFRSSVAECHDDTGAEPQCQCRLCRELLR